MKTTNVQMIESCFFLACPFLTLFLPRFPSPPSYISPRLASPRPVHHPDIQQWSKTITGKRYASPSALVYS